MAQDVKFIILLFIFLLQDLLNYHNTRLVRDTKNIITTFKISRSVTAPYKKNLPSA